MTSLIIITVIIIGVGIYRTFLKKTPSNTKDESLVLPLSTKEFVDKYNSKSGTVKGGSLCFYGHWFGRPFDNYHQVETLTFNKEKDSLTITFNDKESLTIVNPKDIREYSTQIKIQNADKIYWQWYSYGKPQTEENLYFIEINRQDNTLIGQTNVDWYDPDFKDLDTKQPAVFWG